MKASRKKWWLRLTQSGVPVNGSIVHAEFPPKLPTGSGRYVELDDCLGLCCTTSTTTTTTTTP